MIIASYTPHQAMKLFMHMCCGVISIKHSFLEWCSGLRDGAFGVLRKSDLFLLWTLLLRLHISGPQSYFSAQQINIVVQQVSFPFAKCLFLKHGNNFALYSLSMYVQEMKYLSTKLIKGLKIVFLKNCLLGFSVGKILQQNLFHHL